MEVGNAEGVDSTPEINRISMDRIAISSSMFRNRFQSTGDKAAHLGEKLTLESFPSFVEKRFGIHKLEFWSPHFDSTEPAYLTTLLGTLQETGAQLINLQIDAGYKLGSQDEKERQASVDLVKKWIAIAARLGASAARANPGQGNFDAVVRSFRELATFASETGVLLLSENHFGMESDPDLHLSIHREVGSERFKIIADFGNYPEPIDRYRALEMIMPLTYLVSAKVMDLNQSFHHTTFDFDRCLKIATDHGFDGVFSIEQWSQQPVPHHDEAVVDWAIDRIRRHLAAKQ